MQMSFLSAIPKQLRSNAPEYSRMHQQKARAYEERRGGGGTLADISEDSEDPDGDWTPDDDDVMVTPRVGEKRNRHAQQQVQGQHAPHAPFKHAGSTSRYFGVYW
jgi:hypothetical protein